MPKYKDITGKKYNRLAAVRYDGSNAQGDAMWIFLCACGEMYRARASSVRIGTTKSCGCLKREAATAHVVAMNTTHGMHNSAEHKSWSGMLQRCTNERAPGYKDYGARGITVCDRWLKFENFYVDMGPRPENTSLDRVDNNDNYEPGNCRWASRTEQCRNRRSCLPLTHLGVTKLQIEWAELLGIRHGTLYQRLKKGWSVGRAVTTPLQRRGHADLTQT